MTILVKVGKLLNDGSEARSSVSDRFYSEGANFLHFISVTFVFDLSRFEFGVFWFRSILTVSCVTFEPCFNTFA